jgi:hypothetical protein
MSSGIPARALGKTENSRDAGSDGSLGVPFLVTATTVAATAAYTLIESAPKKFRVVDWWVVMTGAGAASDTVKLTDGTNDITDAVDLSSAGDTDRVAGGEIDDAYHELDKGDSLKVATASGATCIVYALCAWV